MWLMFFRHQEEQMTLGRPSFPGHTYHHLLLGGCSVPSVEGPGHWGKENSMELFNSVPPAGTSFGVWNVYKEEG